MESKCLQHIVRRGRQFCLESGLLDEPERAKLLNLVLEHSDDSMSSHLCMLGTSLIILPKNIDQEVDFGTITSDLRSLGLGVRETILQ